MGNSFSRLLYLIPRYLSVVMILFLGLFAADSFDGTAPLIYQIGGFIMHLVPNFLLMIILIIAWKYEKLGGLLFILTGILFWVFFKNPLWINAIIFGPLFIIGWLFLLSGYLSGQVRGGNIYETRSLL